MRVGLGLGSNLGDRLEHLRQARARILAIAAVSRSGWICAPLYETGPVDCPPGSGLFLNTVMELEVSDHLSMPRLLEGLRDIEAALGRPSRHPRNAPRPADIDILYAGDLVLDSPQLTLPHPRLALRRFVLEPLAALRPELILPGHDRSVARLLHDLEDPGIVRMVLPDW